MTRVGRAGAASVTWLIMMACAAATTPATPPAPDDLLTADLRYLSSPALDGRATGSPGNDSAAAYLTRAYERLQLSGLFPAPSCTGGAPCRALYYQMVFPPVQALVDAGIREDATAQNIAAVVPGSDPALRAEYVIVGAHFDHLGRTGYGARDIITARMQHLGADDNASGTAAVLELARRLARTPTRRPVAFVHFGSEELGLFGSRAFVRRPPFALDSAVAMINLDMVGRLRRDRVWVYGLETSRAWAGIVKAANTDVQLRAELHDELGDAAGTSDHENFVALNVPSLHLTTGLHEDWHTAGDRFARLNLAGERRVIDFVERLVRALADSTLSMRPARQ